ncbi:MAG: EscU/YscU/HrcU family type III secretion system export apparatus switch protein [Pseudomonadota bacterium]|nr:EscU/YscU/HrcU family type III secretion system export apparatus switch protein [Pseudomonadota bacterium]
MADKDKGGDKTELPTRRKLEDARKKGDIAKGKEITPTLGTIVAAILFMTAAGFIANRVTAFADATVASATKGEFQDQLIGIGGEAALLLLTLSVIILAPLCAIAVLSEVLQTKALVAPKKLEPKLETLNPVEGIKRLFGKQGLIELAKTLMKVAAIIAVVWFVARDHLEQMATMLLPAMQPVWREGAGMQAGTQDAAHTLTLVLQVFAWTGAVFVLVAVVDTIWARQQFTKKMMMSRRDIKDEHKRDEGDPHIKGHRRQMAQEWAQSGAVSQTADANALLVNPTHLAIALEYDADKTPIPVVLARGEGEVAEAMREVARQSGIPIVRHIPTARQLWARGEVGEMVPEEMFDAIAEIILWARKARSGEAPLDCDLHREPNTSHTRKQAQPETV